MEINNLTLNEEKLRNLYLRKIALGEIYGPLTGKPSQDKIWLKYYSEEAIKEDYNNDSIAQNMVNASIKYAEKKSSTFSKIDRTFAEDIIKGNVLAKALRAYGIKPGDKVTVSVPSIPEYRYLFYAINKVGAVSVWLDFRTGESELEECIKRMDSKLFFIFGGICQKIEDAITKVNEEKPNSIKNVIEINPSDTVPELFISKILSFKEKVCKKKSTLHDIKINYNDFLSLAEKIDDFECYNFPENATAAIVYTGGTTGSPKGVELTNENFNAVVNGYRNTDLDFAAGDNFLQFLPPWTAYGLVIDYVCFSLGLNSIYIPKLDPSSYDKLIIQNRAQHTTGIPKNIDILVNSRSIKASTDLSFLKTAAVGADTMHASKETNANEFLKHHNCSSQVVKGYGMTEETATICTTTNKKNKIGSVGIPFVKNEIKIIDPDTKEELGYHINEEAAKKDLDHRPDGNLNIAKEDNIGEICYSGPSLMKGYYNNPEETNSAVEIDQTGKRWMHSGDLGYVDEDGFLYIIGRIKKLVVRSGFKIFTTNIDNIVSQHPEVENVVSVGIPDDVEGSIPVVNVVLQKNCLKDQKELIAELNALLDKKLADYYFPLTYRFIKSIPYTKNGKVDFVKLTRETIAELKPSQTLTLK